MILLTIILVYLFFRFSAFLLERWDIKAEARRRQMRRKEPRINHQS